VVGALRECLRGTSIRVEAYFERAARSSTSTESEIRGSGPIKGTRSRLMICSLRCAAGTPEGSRRAIWRRRSRFSTSWRR